MPEKMPIFTSKCRKCQRAARWTEMQCPGCRTSLPFLTIQGLILGAMCVVVVQIGTCATIGILSRDSSPPHSYGTQEAAAPAPALHDVVQSSPTVTTSAAVQSTPTAPTKLKTDLDGLSTAQLLHKAHRALSIRPITPDSLDEAQAALAAIPEKDRGKSQVQREQKLYIALWDRSPEGMKVARDLYALALKQSKLAQDGFIRDAKANEKTLWIEGPGCGNGLISALVSVRKNVRTMRKIGFEEVECPGSDWVYTHSLKR